MRRPTTFNPKRVLRPAILSLLAMLLVPAAGDGDDFLAPVPTMTGTLPGTARRFAPFKAAITVPSGSDTRDIGLSPRAEVSGPPPE